MSTLTALELVQNQANAMLAVPLEQWHERGIKMSAVSANADGHVNSFIATVRGFGRVYGHRKHEFKDGAFTGREWFEIERMPYRG